GVLDRTQRQSCMEESTFKTQTTLFFEDGPGSVLETVGCEFQPPFETGYPGGGAHVIFVLRIFASTNETACATWHRPGGWRQANRSRNRPSSPGTPTGG
ncbi:MAG: hypothetical protein WBN03_05200, partial [Desulfobacterales bacterium]